MNAIHSCPHEETATWSCMSSGQLHCPDSLFNTAKDLWKTNWLSTFVSAVGTQRLSHSSAARLSLRTPSPQIERQQIDPLSASEPIHHSAADSSAIARSIGSAAYLRVRPERSQVYFSRGYCSRRINLQTRRKSLLRAFRK